MSFLDLDFWVGVGVVAGIYGIFALGLQLNVGFTGLLNLGQAGFMCVGAYAMAMLVVDAGWPLALSFAGAIVVAVAVGVLVGLPSLRLRADYFGIVTIAFSEIVRYVFQNAAFAGGNQGVIGYDAEWRAFQAWASERLVTIGLGEVTQVPLLIAVWAVLLLCLAALKALEVSPWGRVLKAIREDEDAAAALGKNVFAFKLAVPRHRGGAGDDRGLLPRHERHLSLPKRVRSELHLLRLRRADPRRFRELRRGRRRRGAPLRADRGPALP